VTTQPPAAAVRNGHTLDWDPPHALSAALRWTCRHCFATALNYRGNEYGDATEVECPGPEATS
jgi:hypothetical protein